MDKLKNSPIKLIFLYSLLAFIGLFCFIWLVDILLTSFNPNYRPLLDFLSITAKLLEVVVGL